MPKVHQAAMHFDENRFSVVSSAHYWAEGDVSLITAVTEPAAALLVNLIFDGRPYRLIKT